MQNRTCRWVVLLSIAIGLSACATGAQQAHNRMVDHLETQKRDSDACQQRVLNRVLNTEGGRKIAEKIVTDNTKYDFRLLSSNEKMDN